MASILTFNQVIDLLQDIAQRSYLINTFFLGRDWELENNNDITYPVLQVYPEFARMPQTNGDFKTLNVRFICKVVDLVSQDESNEKDVHSDTLRISQDIVNEINQHPYYQRSNANIIGDIDFTNLEEYEDDFAAGWEFTLNLQLINNNSYCGLPFEELPGYSASGPVSDGYSYSVQYLTCNNLIDCQVIQDLQNYYGSFSFSGNQTGNSGVVLKMSADTEDNWNNGVSLSGGTKFMIDNPGVYNIQFSSQMVKSAGNNTTHIHIWLSQNGTDVPNSATQVGFPSNSVYQVPSWNWFFETTTPSEYVEIKWEINSNTNNAVTITSQAISGNVPSIPGNIITINKVG